MFFLTEPLPWGWMCMEEKKKPRTRTRPRPVQEGDDDLNEPIITRGERDQLDAMMRRTFDAKLERDLEEMEHGTDQMGA